MKNGTENPRLVSTAPSKNRAWRPQEADCGRSPSAGLWVGEVGCRRRAGFLVLEAIHGSARSRHGDGVELLAPGRLPWWTFSSAAAAGEVGLPRESVAS